jgi:hypothetical protein
MTHEPASDADRIPAAVQSVIAVAARCAAIVSAVEAVRPRLHEPRPLPEFRR